MKLTMQQMYTLASGACLSV